ncbi:hypothetical protein MMC28_000563 [Mycoblastus sanguinarius]|nr:hypothetical protein [Mycoblastus sanguinarius]
MSGNINHENNGNIEDNSNSANSLADDSIPVLIQYRSINTNPLLPIPVHTGHTFINVSPTIRLPQLNDKIMAALQATNPVEPNNPTPLPASMALDHLNVHWGKQKCNFHEPTPSFPRWTEVSEGTWDAVWKYLQWSAGYDFIEAVLKPDENWEGNGEVIEVAQVVCPTAGMLGDMRGSEQERRSLEDSRGGGWC